jgi:hypothetical protein
MAGYAGGTTASDIARLRRMISESGTATYTDATLAEIISYYPVPDVAGHNPRLYSGSVNTTWVATFDLASAASDIWAEKAAALATGAYDFTADGATFNRSQISAAAKTEAGKWAARRMALPRELRADLGLGTEVQRWIGNLSEVTYNDEE